MSTNSEYPPTNHCCCYCFLFLGTLILVIHSEYLEERLHEFEVSLTAKQDLEIDMLKGDVEQLVYETATEAADDLLFTERFAEAIGHTVTQDPDVACNEEMVEMKKFVRGQMKMAKDAPETSQDVLREHEAEIGF
jgi:hypothetical protein